MGYKFPFATAIDRRGMTLVQRMEERMSAGAQEYPVYNCLAEWEGAAYVATVTEVWGRYGRQFLALEAGCTYVGICQSEGWWYVVSMAALPQIFQCGGWAPPSFFVEAGYTRTLRQVPVSELRAVCTGPDPARLLTFGIRVFVDGSADDKRGIVVGCLVAGEYTASRASLALPGITGGETGELLGIILGLMQIRLLSRWYTRFAVMVDNNNAVGHIFKCAFPERRDGWDLWPAILLGREIVCRLESIGISVTAEWVRSRDNLAHGIAVSECRTRRQGHWDRGDDCFSYPLDVVFGRYSNWFAGTEAIPTATCHRIRRAKKF